ncbi:hypothetical protein BH24ACT3_BH24ACT3_02470 [soil metagenome]
MHILTGMTKRLVDLDDAKLAAVGAELGTTTLNATVDAAFDEVLGLTERRAALLAEVRHEVDVLADPGDRARAWR